MFLLSLGRSREEEYALTGTLQTLRFFIFF
jgi:hypothetical protein